MAVAVPLLPSVRLLSGRVMAPKLPPKGEAPESCAGVRVVPAQSDTADDRHGSAGLHINLIRCIGSKRVRQITCHQSVARRTVIIADHDRLGGIESVQACTSIQQCRDRRTPETFRNCRNPKKVACPVCALRSYPVMLVMMVFLPVTSLITQDTVWESKPCSFLVDCSSQTHQFPTLALFQQNCHGLIEAIVSDAPSDIVQG